MHVWNIRILGDEVFLFATSIFKKGMPKIGSLDVNQYPIVAGSFQ